MKESENEKNPLKKLNAEKLLERSASQNLQDGKEFTFRFYTLKREDTLYKDKDGVTYYYPHLTGNIYFVAEVSINLNPGGGWSVHQHFFQLDLASIKIELEKIEKMDSADIRFQPEGIANVLNDRYAEATNWLVDYCGNKDNYAELAALIYKHRGTAPAGRFGV